MKFLVFIILSLMLNSLTLAQRGSSSSLSKEKPINFTLKLNLEKLWTRKIYGSNAIFTESEPYARIEFQNFEDSKFKSFLENTKQKKFSKSYTKILTDIKKNILTDNKKLLALRNKYEKLTGIPLDITIHIINKGEKGNQCSIYIPTSGDALSKKQKETAEKLANLISTYQGIELTEISKESRSIASNMGYLKKMTSISVGKSSKSHINYHTCSDFFEKSFWLKTTNFETAVEEAMSSFSDKIESYKKIDEKIKSLNDKYTHLLEEKDRKQIDTSRAVLNKDSNSIEKNEKSTGGNKQ